MHMLQWSVSPITCFINAGFDCICEKHLMRSILPPHNIEYSQHQKAIFPGFQIWRLIYINTKAENMATMLTMLDFRLPPRCKWDLRSSGMLHGVDWQSNLSYVTSQKNEGLISNSNLFCTILKSRSARNLDVVHKHLKIMKQMYKIRAYYS